MAEEKNEGASEVSESNKMEAESKPKKSGKSGGEKPKGEAKSPNKTLYLLIAIAIAAAVIIAAVALSSGKKEDPTKGDAMAVASALESSRQAMYVAEAANDLTIQRSAGVVTKNSTSYLVSFPINGSADYLAFDVLMDKDLTLTHVGFNGNMTTLGQFIADNKGLNQFQECARIFNEQDAVPNLVGLYNGTPGIRTVVTMPQVMTCNGVDYPYEFEIGDGYIKTSINGYFYKSSFTRGIVVDNLTVPADDMGKGILLYADRVARFKLRFSYELKNASALKFDLYDPMLIDAYHLTVAPSVVWNCKFVSSGTKATGELNGTFQKGTERYAFAKMACIFNDAEPKELCEQLGVVKGADGKINATMPADYALTMFETGIPSCKPEGKVLLQAFYPPDCADCENQRRILDEMAAAFGGSIELQYYCAGKKEPCEKLVSP